MTSCSPVILQDKYCFTQTFTAIRTKQTFYLLSGEKKSAKVTFINTLKFTANPDTYDKDKGTNHLKSLCIFTDLFVCMTQSVSVF